MPKSAETEAITPIERPLFSFIVRHHQAEVIQPRYFQQESQPDEAHPKNRDIEVVLPGKGK
jgi:hypothetical protein